MSWRLHDHDDDGSLNRSRELTWADVRGTLDVLVLVAQAPFVLAALLVRALLSR